MTIDAPGIGQINADPRFLAPHPLCQACGVDPGGDYRIPCNSPLVDAGDPTPLDPGYDSLIDLAGAPRVVNGRRDIGAYEYQPGSLFCAPAVKGPSIAKLAQSASVWRLGNSLAQLSQAPKLPVGTTFSFKLDAVSTVRMQFTRLLAGRSRKGRCVAPALRNRRAPKCTRTRPAGTLTFSGHAGADQIRFEGRLTASKRLPLGRYKVTVTAINSHGASTPRSLTFTIAKS
jgi:hypothetical protein